MISVAALGLSHIAYEIRRRWDAEVLSGNGRLRGEYAA